jgi:hypothetical protein
VQARWNENGHDVTQTQQVTVSAGASVRVDFPVTGASSVAVADSPPLKIQDRKPAEQAPKGEPRKVGADAKEMLKGSWTLAFVETSLRQTLFGQFKARWHIHCGWERDSVSYGGPYESCGT